MNFRPCLSAILLPMIGALLIPSAAGAGERQQVLDALKWAEPVMGKTCNFAPLKGGKDLADSHYYEIKYRYRGQDQDSPDNIFPLFQLLCDRGAYNKTFIFLTKGDNGYRLLPFALPQIDYDYADEEFTKLKAPPRITGYKAVTDLANASFDPKTDRISMRAQWRGLGDAWSSGEWQFFEGEFILSEYIVDPVYEANSDHPEALRQEKYTIYKTGTP
jgi:hypothetical protein